MFYEDMRRFIFMASCLVSTCAIITNCVVLFSMIPHALENNNDSLGAFSLKLGCFSTLALIISISFAYAMAG